MDRGGVARLTTVPFGRAATDALAEVITTAKGGDLLAPVTVVVPGNLTGLALRRELGARPGGIVNVRFMVLDRLAELLGAGVLAAEGRTPLDDAVRAALVRQVLAERPAPLARVAEAETTQHAVSEFLDELERSERGALEVLRGHSVRGRALAAIADRFHDRATSFYDEHDLARTAARAICDGDADLRDIGQVILHLPHRLTHAQLALVDALVAADRLWALVGLTGEAAADEVATRLRAHLEVGLGSAASRTGGPAVSTTVVEAPDALAEVRAAMRIVAAELAAERPLHHIAIVYRQREPYAALLDEELSAAGIPMHGPSVRTLAQTVAGRTLLGALALADEQFSRVAVLQWMSANPVRADGRRARAATWGRTARKAGVVRGAQQWTDRLGRNALDPDAAPLAAFVAELVEDCGVSQRGSWTEWANWAQDFLRRRLGSPAIRRRWSEAELTAYDQVERIVEALRPISELEPGPITREKATSHLAAMLDAPAGRRGRFSEGVLCGSLHDVVGVDLDMLVVLGMTEGSFPPVSVSSAVLSESERVAIGSPESRSLRAHDERRMFVAALASAERRFLLHPRVGAARVAHPAPWLIAEARDHELSIDSFDAELAQPSGPAASLQEHDLRELRSWPRAALSAHPLVAQSPALARGIVGAQARAGDTFSEWEGNLGSHDELAIGRAVLSATSLQAWATCPAQYLFKQVLGVHELDEIVDVDGLEAKHRGTLIHAILERLGREHLARLPADEQLRLALGPGVSWTASARASAERVTNEVLDEFENGGGAPYPILWNVERRRIFRDVMRTLESDEPGAQLVAVEHRFGREEEEQPAFTLNVQGEKELRFRGMIDRVDKLDGQLRVIDYKTGTRESEDTVRAGIASGKLLQLPLYGLAAQREFAPSAEVAAGYWYVSSKGGWKRVIIPIDETIRDRFFESLDVISSGIADGVFPANPGPEGYKTFSNCVFCDYKRICPSDRDRAWQRLHDAPELGRYRQLSEPSVDDEAGDE